MAAEMENLALKFVGVETDAKAHLIAEAQSRKSFLEGEHSASNVRGVAVITGTSVQPEGDGR